LAGQVVIGWLGRYGIGARSLIPNWLDIAIVVAFALTIFYWAISLANGEAEAAAAIAKDSACETRGHS
jgi:hypothetical protein